MALTDKTKRAILIVVWAAIVLSIILSFVEARFEEQKAALSISSIKSLRLAGTIVLFITMPLLVSLVALFFYSDRLRNKVDGIESAARLRRIALIIPWLTIILLALIGIKFVIVLYYRSDHLIYDSIQFLLIGLPIVYLLLYSWTMAEYCRIKPLHTIVAACLCEQSGKFIHTRDFDRAYAALVKASETAPEEVELWCRLAFFCEMIRKDTAEADKFMAKAEELITSKKATRDSEKACYLNYLGTILYERGDYQKGLEYIKQSIDIEPRPGRISSYEKKLSESRDKQQDPSNNAG